MELGNKEAKKKEILENTMVHRVLAHSYFVYFIFLIISVVLDIIYPVHIFRESFTMPAGVVLLVLGTILILWAQNTSRNLHKENMSPSSFLNGPYYYTRIPTRYGLCILMLGFGFVANAFFVIMFSFISLLINKFHFLKRQEEILEAKYGEHYKEYKKIVKH